MKRNPTMLIITMPVVIAIGVILLHSFQQCETEIYDLTAETIKQQNTIAKLNNRLYDLTLNNDEIVPISNNTAGLNRIDVDAIELRVKEVLSTRSWRNDSAYIAARECSFIIKSELTRRGVPFQ